MARSSGSTLRMKQQRSGSVLYRGPGSVRGLSSTRLRPYRLANPPLNAYVSAQWKLGDPAAQPRGVQPFGVAADALVGRGLRVHLDERSDPLAPLVANRAVGRDRGRDHRHAVPREQLGDVADATDVGVAVLAREPEALGEVLAHLVPVEHFDRDAATAQLRAHAAGERGFARAGQSGKPQREAVRLRDARIRCQLALSHLSPTIPFVPPLRVTERGIGGEAKTNRARPPSGKRARSASRVPFTS